METGKIQEFRERANAYYSSKTPAHIITIKDSWINGFITSVEDLHFKVLDKINGIVRIHYIDIELFEEYRGPVSKLRLPPEIITAFELEEEKLK